MKFLSFDVGIKNLAYWIVNYELENPSQFKIDNWGIINISCDDLCEHINTKNNKCINSATFSHINNKDDEKLGPLQITLIT